MQSNLTTNIIQRSVVGFLAILIIFFASYANQSHTLLQGDKDDIVNTAEDDKTDNSSDDHHNQNTNDDCKIVAYEAVVPLIHANFSPQQYFFLKIQVISEDFIEEEEEFLLPFISYFNTLFRLIISPNAP